MLLNNKSFSERPIELKDKNMLIIGLGGIGICLADNTKLWQI